MTNKLFGIYHLITDANLFKTSILKIKNSKNDKIRIAGCWDLTKKYNVNLYKEAIWYFAGSIFGGNSENLIIFADLMKEKCLRIIQEEQTLMWEVNIWYMLYHDNKELFNQYLSNFSISILENY